MKKFLAEATKAVLAIIFMFYLCVAILSVSVPAYKNIFMLVSCSSTILTLALCFIIASIDFFRLKFFKKIYWKIDFKNLRATVTRIYHNVKILIKSLRRPFAFAGMLVLYICYAIAEFNIISVNFSYIALGFDFFTSLFSYLIIERQDVK